MIRLISQTYDSGDRHYMSVIDEWTDTRTPCWKFKCTADNVAEYEELVTWIINSASYGYDYDYRFNNGSPYLMIEFVNEADALAFRMRFTCF